MLDQIASRYCREVLVRFASHRTDEDFLGDQDMTAEQIAEMKELLMSRGVNESLEELVDTPFKPKRQLYKSGYAETRFSDGTFPVGYFAMEPETAEAEVRYWFCKNFFGRPSDKRRAWYSRFTCDFAGHAKDLRPMQAAWPDLMNRTDYAFCRRLGTQAMSEGLDALLTPSVRKSSGTNVPVFVRRALKRSSRTFIGRDPVRSDMRHGR